jgi:hypothetical protein|nr:MAG TPA: hypothetical protein [Caudoviricetes sp.]
MLYITLTVVGTSREEAHPEAADILIISKMLLMLVARLARIRGQNFTFMV